MNVYVLLIIRSNVRIKKMFLNTFFPHINLLIIKIFMTCDLSVYAILLQCNVYVKIITQPVNMVHESCDYSIFWVIVHGGS